MLQLRHDMRTSAFLLAFALVAGCNRGGDDAPLRRTDGSLVSDAGGEVSLSDGSRLQFVITSERYKQWDAARDGLSRDVVARYGVLLKPKAPTKQSIDRAAAFLESNPTAKQSIERTGMSVRDFVLMTVALEQEMQLASARGQTPASATPMPVDTSAYALPTVPPPYASGYPPQATYAPAPAYPTPPVYDSAPRRDTIVRPLPPPRVDSTYRRDTVPRPADSGKGIRRDTASPAPVKRDSAPAPVKSDSAPSPPKTDSVPVRSLPRSSARA